MEPSQNSTSQPGDAPVNGAKVFCGNLSWSMTQDDLTDLMSQFGQVVSATIISDRATGRSKGFGFVEFAAADMAQAAVEALDGTEVNGRNIAVSIARPQAPREDRPFGGSRGGSRGGFGGGRPSGGRSFDNRPPRRFDRSY